MGIGEILLVLLVVLLVFGPERLPMLARHCGRVFAQIQHFQQQFKSQLEQQIALDELAQREAKAKEVERENQ